MTPRHSHKRKQSIGRSRRRQRGAQTVEFVLLLSWFLFLIFSILEGVRMINAYTMTAHLAREGVRYAVVRGSAAAEDAGRSDAPATAASIRAYINDISPLTSVTVPAPTWSDPGKAPGSVVTITVQYEFSSAIPLLDWLGVRTLSASSSGTILN
jgi:Flp pilus assembly protein TadG